MTRKNSWAAERQMLAEAGVSIAAGLTEGELQLAEAVIEHRMPTDLREFLSEGLPLGRGFPNWREPRSKEIRERLEWPYEGIAFDIEHNSFWWQPWGERPASLGAALELARDHVAAAPRLIPIAGHRFIPAEPELSGNPVMSVYQTDIIHYGTDLSTYLQCEFGQMPYEQAVRAEPRRIRFWSELVEANK